MNYLWQLLLKLQDQEVDLESIRFEPAKSYSPYMELSQVDINNIEIDRGQVVEINPYYRFFSIFKDMFSLDLDEYKELRYGLFHLIIHMIAKNDLKQGMSREEYYKKFLYADILQGCYGEEVKNMIVLFDIKERNIILNGILKLYSAGDSLDLLKEMVISLFYNTIMYNNIHHKNQILIYIGVKKTKELEKKVEMVLNLFGNLQYNIELYYQHHFAILGMDDTCLIEEIALY